MKLSQEELEKMLERHKEAYENGYITWCIREIEFEKRVIAGRSEVKCT